MYIERHPCPLFPLAPDPSFRHLGFRTFQRADAPHSPKSSPLNLFADPHPLNLCPSILYKKGGGGGVIRSFARSDVLTRRVPGAQGLSPLDATLMRNPASIDSNWLTVRLHMAKSFSCNTYKKHGGWGGISSSTCRPSDVRTFRRSVRPIAVHALWCHNPQRPEISLRSRETTPLPPVSKTERADNGDGSILIPLASRAWVQRSNVEPPAGWLALKRRVGKAGSVRLG